MPNNQDFGTTGSVAAPFGSLTPPPVTPNQPAPGSLPEDIFAHVDKPVMPARPLEPAAVAPVRPLPADLSAPSSLPNATTAMPSVPALPQSGGSMKYLLIGLVSLVLLLVVGFAVYQFVLKPQFDQVAIEPVANDTEQNQAQTATDLNLGQNNSPAAPEMPVEPVDEPTNEPVVAEAVTVGAEATKVPATASDVATVDSDNDGLSDLAEDKFGTNKLSPDSDNDGLNDKEEVEIYKTDPLIEDSDGDGYLDGAEVKNGYNPAGQGRLFIR